eukprot:CAMPEP_0171052930 /NCGR_PEP_ID=MMETSP0736-20130129/54146_1 /TAXON_ID=186038 /ORGANISM="Fragilariopsis kerguelensis, Strain L26-C5" /LENGTH=854 /DNA_ID=CAMNT_0011506701 /DNA_START=71 /DNA_END=2636 /DNA_ORIENTATION=-
MKFNTLALSSIAMGAMLQFESLHAAGIRNDRRRLQSDDSCLSITDYVCSDKEYSTLCAALKKYELADTLQDGAWTLFAPNNEAFEGLLPSYADDYLEILKFHVLKETVMYDDLICMDKVETVLGQMSRTKCSTKGKFQTGAGNLVVGDEVMLPKLKSTMVEDTGSEDSPSAADGSGEGYGSTSDIKSNNDSGDNLVCSEVVRSQPKNDPWTACGVELYPSGKTTLPSPPNVWQKNNCYDDKNADAVYDLAIIGAGIGGCYLANQLRLGKAHSRTIAMYEGGQNVGGRLMSAFHAGALGIPVRPLDMINDVAPPEYGGMRISPVYKLVFQQVMNMWEQSFKEQALKINPKAQCDIAFCGVLENMPNCCSGLLTPMNVGRVFYYSDEASLTDANDLYNNYTVSDIANYKELSPYQQCIMLAVGANDYATKNPSWQPTNAVVGFKELCLKPMCNFTEGYCGLCSEFVSGEEATAVVSCTGYDTAADTQTVRALIGLASEVVNIAGVTYLYLFTVGYQRLAQGLLEGTEVNSDGSGYSTLAIAPHFEKKLVAVGVGPGDFDKAVNRARVLAQKQVDTLNNKAVKDDDGPTSPIQLQYSDGSMTVSHIAYLTMLPFDAVGNPFYDSKAIEGLEPWYEPMKTMTVPNEAFKAIVQWSNYSLSDHLGYSPCVNITDGVAGTGKCDRIILDGNRPNNGIAEKDSQVVRQAWMWDKYQILFYTVGNQESPAHTNIELQNEHGMNTLVELSIEELRNATKGIISKVDGKPIEIPQPSWFRGKTWPEGSLMINWNLDGMNETGWTSATFSETFNRPFGEDVNIWYGNSEMAADGGLHGWAEGALSMANLSLPGIELAFGKLEESE